MMNEKQREPHIKKITMILGKYFTKHKIDFFDSMDILYIILRVLHLHFVKSLENTRKTEQKKQMYRSG